MEALRMISIELSGQVIFITGAMGATGIRVNVVSPGNVAAGSSLKVFEEDASYREFVLRIGLGRRNSPESIADTFVFLCSRLANEINGQILSPDYGAGIGNRL
jgi:NAD(P)-dependent dehydrogenase (short-subunit alcohol dehydrogenase family)